MAGIGLTLKKPHFPKRLPPDRTLAFVSFNIAKDWQLNEKGHKARAPKSPSLLTMPCLSRRGEHCNVVLPCLSTVRRDV